MNFSVGTFIATMILVGTGVQVQAAVKPHSNTLRIEAPANNPQLAEGNAHALYLHVTGEGRTLLYVEKKDGRGLAVLDVTDPGRIRRIADTEIPAGLAFDFVREIGDDAALVRYCDGSGYAFLSFKHARQPVLVAAPAFAEVRTSEPLGQTGLLVAVAGTPTAPPIEPRTYRVLDTANNSGPMVLATIPAVTQRVENSETGTLFLLNNDGITVVRRLRVERENQIELLQKTGN